MHLFDIDVPGGIKFKESDTLTGGASLTSFDVCLPFIKIDGYPKEERNRFIDCFSSSLSHFRLNMVVLVLEFAMIFVSLS